MKRNLVIGLLVGFAGVIVVIGLSYGLVQVLHQDETEKEEDQSKADKQIGPANNCCKKLKISGTANKDEFYQEMMGEYTIYEDYPQLDFTRSEHVKDDVAQHIFPVYRHTMFENDPEVSQPKHAYLYYYYNIEPKKKELACPEGCWIISMHDMTPNNYWYGFKYYYVKKKLGALPPLCPDNLTRKRSRFINQKGQKDKGLEVECQD